MICLNKLINSLIMLVMLMMFLLMLNGCTTTTMSVNTNNFRQTNYPTDECYIGNKSFSEIILCLQNASDKEIAQNNITNNLLDNNSEKKN